MYGRDALPVRGFTVAAGMAGFGILIADSTVPSFSGPPLGTVLAVILIAAFVGVIGQPSAQHVPVIAPDPGPAVMDRAPEPTRRARNVIAVVPDLSTAPLIAQPAFQSAINRTLEPVAPL